MTAASRRQIKGARSLKARPAPQDHAKLGNFPPPTEWSEQLALENQNLSRAMAFRLARTTRMDVESLIAVADVGLLKGCRLYDPSRINPATGHSYRLSSCVVPYIRGEMLHYLRDKGHSSGVRFPDTWRDVAPRVRRLAAEGRSLESIGADVGLLASEVEEILQAQRTPAPFDLEVGDLRHGAPDPLDEAEEHEDLAEALAIVDQAFQALHWGDQQMLVSGWQLRRPTLALLPHGQFLCRVQRILRGQTLEPPQGKPLSFATTQPRLTKSDQILETAEQLGLFGACQDQGGKTAIADEGSAGEGISDRQSPHH